VRLASFSRTYSQDLLLLEEEEEEDEDEDEEKEIFGP
jgi:hypothetical protein